MGHPAHLRSRYLGPGDKLGKYDLIRQIAVGGMAELYLARTVGLEGFEKLVVIKRILPQYVDNPSFVEMFLAEARLAATLHHPNIAQVYDFGRDDGDYFFAMEYVHGEDLHRIAVTANEQGVPISMDAALTLAAGLCAGLHHAHEKAGADGRPLQIVHRDVSPSNVLVTYDGGVKLVDFGVARAAKRHVTGPGLKGKVAYMSPEQGKSARELDRRSDLYAVGTLLYELTTGRLPFEGQTEYEILEQIVHDDAPPPSRFVPAYPPALEAIVMRALARDPAVRYPTALLLQGDVEDFAHENRLRISPLVLARLMENLFPERLEEWAHARARGAFFIEQHVVRTLIESGKTPDPEEQQRRLAAEAAAAAPSPSPPAGDDDPTSVNTPGIAPRTTPPRAEPVVTAASLFAAQHAPVAPVHEVTERVRLPRAPSPTSYVRPARRRWALLAIAAAVVTAGAIAAVIAFEGTGTGGLSTLADPGTSAAAPASPAAPPRALAPAVAPMPAAAPVPPVARAPVAPAESAPPPAAVPVAAPPPPSPHRAPHEGTHPHAHHIHSPHPAKRAKEKPWNDDSPFMPVRTGP